MAGVAAAILSFVAGYATLQLLYRVRLYNVRLYNVREAARA